MKGAINYYGDSNVQFIMLNNGGLDTGEAADERWQRYGMPPLPRVRMNMGDAERTLVSQFGHFGYGYIVIDSDGKLLGVSVGHHDAQHMIDVAVNGEPDDELDESGGFAITSNFADKKGGRTGWNIDDQLPAAMTGTLQLQLSLPAGFHIYGDGKGNPEPTRVEVKYADGLTIGAIVVPSGTPAAGGATHLDGPVTISIPITAKKGLAIGTYFLHGTVHFMACDAQRCLPPMDLPWTATIEAL